MRTQILYFLLLFYSISIAQSKDKVFVHHGNNPSTLPCYTVSQLIIHSDSTYTISDYCTTKKEWKKYKEIVPETDYGKIKKDGKYFVLTEYRNNKETNEERKVKITKSKVVFYYPIGNGKMRRGAKYKKVMN